MLKYKIDVMTELKNAGYSTYRIRTERLLNETILTSIRNNKIIGIHALDKLCALLDMQPGDIIEFRKDE